MGCNDALAQGLQAIADALESSGQSAVGGGCQGLMACLNGYTDDQILDTPAEDVDPNGQTPPDGFDTMAEYLEYKCKAANLVFDAVRNFIGGLSAMAGLQFVASTIGPLLVALIGGIVVPAVVFPPATVAALLAAVIAGGLLFGASFIVFQMAANYLEDNRAAIICELYASGSAEDAIAAIASVIEDFVQTEEFAALLGGPSTPAAQAFGSIIALSMPNQLFNPLFQLVEDIAYPGADCGDCSGVCSWRLDQGAGAIVEGAPFTLSSEEDPNNHYHYITFTLTDVCCPTLKELRVTADGRSAPQGAGAKQWLDEQSGGCPGKDPNWVYNTNGLVALNTPWDVCDWTALDTSAPFTMTFLIQEVS